MLTERQLLTLCELVYYDVPDALARRVGAGLTAGEICAYTGEVCAPIPAPLAENVLGDTALRDLVLTDYVNENGASGLVAFAWRQADGTIVAVFRGSEWNVRCGVDGRDWTDNLLAPFSGSVQYEGAARFAARFADRPLVVTGHSKGANLALYAFAHCGGERAVCVCFDGQGFARDAFTAAQNDVLARRAVNYVHRDDPVGALLFHPERRVFVEGRGDAHPHAPESLLFDEAGHPVPARRTARSRAIGLFSQSYIRARDLYAPGVAPAWIRALAGMDSHS